MRQLSILFACVAFFMGISSLQAQKIAYMDLEAALALMPETKEANTAIKTYEQKLVQSLQARDGYYRSLLEEYQELAGTGSAGEDLLKEKETKIREVQAELQQKQQESQQKLGAKQQELMAPILEKLSGAMKDYANANGYQYVLNTSSNGTSIILHGVETDNITKAVLTKLGVKIPEQ